MGKFAPQGKSKSLNLKVSPVNHALICALANAHRATITDYLLSLVQADYQKQEV